MTGRRGWGIATALTFGTPLVALVAVAVLAHLQINNATASLWIVAFAIALTVLGIHLIPLAWWARGLIACVYLPILAAGWVMAVLVTVCAVANQCL